MRTQGLWHPRLLAILAAAGHGDLIVVADSGLPVAAGVETIDLLWRRGEPRFLPVLETLLDECVVERATVAAELADPVIRKGLDRALSGIPVQKVEHDELKRLAAQAVAIVRTGEATPYANVVLHAGVAF